MGITDESGSATRGILQNPNSSRVDLLILGGVIDQISGTARNFRVGIRKIGQTTVYPLSSNDTATAVFNMFTLLETGEELVIVITAGADAGRFSWVVPYVEVE